MCYRLSRTPTLAPLSFRGSAIVARATPCEARCEKQRYQESTAHRVHQPGHPLEATAWRRKARWRRRADVPHPHLLQLRGRPLRGKERNQSKQIGGVDAVLVDEPRQLPSSKWTRQCPDDLDHPCRALRRVEETRAESVQLDLQTVGARSDQWSGVNALSIGASLKLLVIESRLMATEVNRRSCIFRPPPSKTNQFF